LKKRVEKIGENENFAASIINIFFLKVAFLEKSLNIVRPLGFVYEKCLKKYSCQIAKTIDSSMKKTFLKVSALALLALTAAGCGQPTSNGQLIGDQTRMNYRPPLPIGMVFVPSGTYKMGASDEDIRGRNDATIHTVQVVGFYMDATEVSNQEYRQFTNWVRDSIANTILGNFKDLPDGRQVLDNKRINWKDPELQDQLTQMYVPAELSGWGEKRINASALKYHYTSFDYYNAAMHPTESEIKYNNNFEVPIYPDTTVWVRQFNYSYNEPIARQYFWFQGFNRYPVVGVNWTQTHAFCDWRTRYWQSEREKQKFYFEGRFRLPTEQEWEWAARGGRNESPYPWGGPYIINKKGCYLANFKPQRGNYSADGGLYTVPVDWYAANDYGLKNMSGNVSEWTESAFFGGSYNQQADINPSVTYNVQGNEARDKPYLARKVVRGGSWRDVSYYLQVSTRDYEYQDTSKAYIGFRCVLSQVAPALTNRRPIR
jgi:formylglycine-generating enzyme required for sulfatase activity